MLDHELETLLKRIAGGDESALAVLYDRTNKLLFSLLCHMLGDVKKAEETLVNAYTELWKQAPLYSPQLGSAFSWMVSITRSCAIEKREENLISERSESISDLLCLEIAQSTESKEDFILERHQFVSSIINELVPEQRQVLALAYFSCLNQREITERMGLPIETVKLHLRTGMNKLREQLRLSQKQP
jgi:RNA polymerase sigma-70 factor (ECF subfamily)